MLLFIVLLSVPCVVYGNVVDNIVDKTIQALVEDLSGNLSLPDFNYTWFDRTYLIWKNCNLWCGDGNFTGLMNLKRANGSILQNEEITADIHFTQFQYNYEHCLLHEYYYGGEPYYGKSLNNKGRLKLSWTTLSESCRVKVEELSMENFSDLDIDPAVHGKIWMKQFRTGLEPILSKLREHIKSGLNSLMSKVVNKEYTVSTLCNF